MWIDAFIILAALLAAVLYFYVSYRVILPYLSRMNYPFNNATKLLMAFSFVSAIIVLYIFGTPALQVLQSTGESSFTKAIYQFSGLLAIAIVYSIVLFRFSGLVVQITLKENEKAELSKNNFQVAGFHGVVHMFFALLLTEQVVQAILPLFR